jgi:hypothetical protein
MESDKRRAANRQLLDRDFARIRLEQDQQASSDRLLNQLCDLVGLALAPLPVGCGCALSGMSYEKEIEIP